MTTPTGPFELRAKGSVARRQAISRVARYVLLGTTLLAVSILVFLGYDVISSGGSHLDWHFITNYPSRHPDQAGIRAALLGTAWVMSLTIVLAVPVAVSTAIWMAEFAPKGRMLNLVHLNLSNLAGVPSIIYGIVGLTVFVRFFDLGSSILAAAFTLSLMILPMTIIASFEAIRQVPSSYRDASLGLGATRWQTMWHHLLPQAIPGIMTGVILAIARAAGETAALIMIGTAIFAAFDPASVFDTYAILPAQIYDWTTRPQDEFREIAATAIIVLMVLVVGLNLIAVLIRERFRND